MIFIKGRLNLFLIIFAIIGIILIFDGIISIQLQLEETTLFQVGRVIRIILGFTLISISWIIYIKQLKRR